MALCGDDLRVIIMTELIAMPALKGTPEQVLALLNYIKTSGMSPRNGVVEIAEAVVFSCDGRPDLLPENKIVPYGTYVLRDGEWVFHENKPKGPLTSQP
jgi:hypothetical protein